MISPRSLCLFAHDLLDSATPALMTIEILSGDTPYVFDIEHPSYRLSSDGISTRIILHIDHMTDGVYEMLQGLSGERVYDLRAVPLSSIESLALRISMTLYRFEVFMTRDTSHAESLPRIILPTDSGINIDKIMAMIEAQTLARDLVNLPPNAKNPDQYAEIIKSLEWKHHDIIDKKDVELRQEGCGLITAVAAGGQDGAHILTIVPRGLESDSCDRLITGKGVVFDAGGLQIKPDTGMLDMKCDMAGSAAVVASFWYADRMGITHTHVGAIGIVDNLLGERAFKPLDIYTAANGKTVEIHHTDAEGRLVLADVIALSTKLYRPKRTLSIATLTGACMVALGYRYSGVMGDDESTITHLLSSSLPSERYWRLPYDEYYLSKTKGKISDLQNLSQ